MRQYDRLPDRRAARPPKLTPEQIALGRRLMDEGTSVRDVARRSWPAMCSAWRASWTSSTRTQPLVRRPLRPLRRPRSGRRGAGCSIVDRGQGQKAPRLRAVLRRAGNRAQRMGIKVCPERNRHGEPPSFATLNQTRFALKTLPSHALRDLVSVSLIVVRA